MTITEILGILGVGCVAGFASGLMGLGGGIILTPLLRLLLGIPPLIALATPLPVLIPTAISSSVAYFKHRLQDFKLALYILIPALPMTWLGAAMTHVVSGTTLMVLTAIFIMLVALSFLYRSFILKVGDVEHPVEAKPLPTIIIGLLGGFLAGLLAIGGGIIYIPAIIRFFRRPMKVAQATSLAVVTIVAIPGSIKHHLLGNIDWGLGLALVCSMIPASYLGAKLAIRLHNKTLEKIFGVITFIFGIYFLLTETILK
jgi:uncharacterized membrane protein YfcA